MKLKFLSPSHSICYANTKKMLFIEIILTILLFKWQTQYKYLSIDLKQQHSPKTH